MSSDTESLDTLYIISRRNFIPSHFFKSDLFYNKSLLKKILLNFSIFIHPQGIHGLFYGILKELRVLKYE